MRLIFLKFSGFGRVRIKKLVNFGIQIQKFQKIKICVKKLDKIVTTLVKKVFLISTILLDKIQNESKTSKWAHLAHYTRRWYFLSPIR
jgi:hypothetical protein